MSLLLTFFIMLVSLSEIKQDELFQAMVESMRQQFGYESSNASLSPGRTLPRIAELAKLASSGRSMRMMLARGGDKVKAPVGDNPRVVMIRPGSHVNTGTVIFFEESSAELSEANRSDLQLESGEIGGKPQKIEIRGHTTRRPLDKESKHGNHWNLAFERARKTMEFLVSVGIDPARIRISVAGGHEPLNTDIDPKERAKNARVEIFLLDELIETN